MPGLFLVNSLDVARALGDRKTATPQSVREFLERDYLRKSAGGFNHDPAIAACQNMFAGLKSAADAETYCRANGNPAGREQNGDIVKAIGNYACSNVSRCYPHGYLAVVVGRHKGKNIHVGLKAPFTRVSRSQAFVVVPGFRKTFILSEQQIDLPCSLAAAQLARDDFKGADVEYLNVGVAPKGDERLLRVVHGKDRQLLSADELDEVFGVYVRGVILALEGGRGLEKPDLAGYRIIDPDEPPLF